MNKDRQTARQPKAEAHTSKKDRQKAQETKAEVRSAKKDRQKAQETKAEVRSAKKDRQKAQETKAEVRSAKKDRQKNRQTKAEVRSAKKQAPKKLLEKKRPQPLPPRTPWQRIQNFLLVLLPILIVLSLLYSAGWPRRLLKRDFPAAEPDTTPPVLTLAHDKSYFVRPGEQYEEEGYAAYDDRDGDLTKKVEVSVSGSTIRYRVRDEAGNITVRFRQIPLLDTGAQTR